MLDSSPITKNNKNSDKSSCSFSLIRNYQPMQITDLKFVATAATGSRVKLFVRCVIFFQKTTQILINNDSFSLYIAFSVDKFFRPKIGPCKFFETNSSLTNHTVVPGAQRKHRTFESLPCWGNHQWAVSGYFKLVEIHILFLTSKWLEEAGSVLESFLEKKKVRLVFCQGETNFVIFFPLKTSLCMISFEKKRTIFHQIVFSIWH